MLCAAAAIALILANSPWGALYIRLLDVPLAFQLGALIVKKPLLLWVDDGLMAVFFMLVGLEVKREILEGGLSKRANAVLPAIAALGGMVAPALIYLLCNLNNAPALRGWAIPTATDIAFATGVLALLGTRVPPSLKLFLLAVAVIDDLGAIVIIAVFYTAELSLTALALAGIGIAVLIALNLAGIGRRAPYLLVGVVLWVCVLKSGVHATIAGVIVGLAIPLRARGGASPLALLEHDLRPWVAFGVLPLFAFANAGVRLAGIAPAILLDRIQLGVALGLLFRQADRRRRIDLAGDSQRLRRASRRSRLAPGLRHRVVDRHRLYDEPVHRHPRFPGRGLRCRHPHRRAAGIGAFRDLRLCRAAGRLARRSAEIAGQPKSTVMTS